jgi:hypothetical protein
MVIILVARFNCQFVPPALPSLLSEPPSQRVSQVQASCFDVVPCQSAFFDQSSSTAEVVSLTDRRDRLRDGCVIAVVPVTERRALIRTYTTAKLGRS